MFNIERLKNDDGSAIVIALMVMILLMGFAALAITRTTSETFSASNDRTESVTFDAANGCLEIMTRNFDKIFDNKLNPDTADLTRVQGQTPPGMPDFAFTQNVVRTGPAKTVVMNGDMFQGLNALQDRWLLNCLVTHRATDVKVNVQRYFLNNRIPIFQFGIFYDDDMEFHPGPRFDFGGRVHSNSNIFFAANTGLFFSSKVTAHKQLFTDVGKNGSSYSTWGDNVNIKNASGVYVRLNYRMGSVLTSPVNGPPVTTAPQPTAYRNANWAANQGLFQGNLLSDQKLLVLPIKLNAQNLGRTVDLIELVKRGKQVGDLWNENSLTVPRPTGAPSIVPVTAATSDDAVTSSDRYYNKTGIRISLADSKAKLPGCVDATGVAITGPCGIRLDGAAAPGAAGLDPLPGAPRGYQPLPMSDGYRGTELNGERFFRNFNQSNGQPVQMWIKIETVVYNAATQAYDKVDITEDILSLGITEPSTYVNDPRYAANADTRSVIKLQRYNIPGAVIPKSVTAAPNSFLTTTGTDNVVVAGKVTARPSSTNCNDIASWAIQNGGDSAPNSFTADKQSHARRSTTVGASGVPGAVGSTYGCIVPFPINMFDTREGLFNETTSVFDRNAVYNNAALIPAGSKNVAWAGVMSLVDIDVANLKRFLDGTWDAGTVLASGTPFAVANGRRLRSTDIPSSNGWVVYVSDRRGDYDFDGEYDMEDVFGNNNNTLDPGEDVNVDGRLQSDTVNESAPYTSSVAPDLAAPFDHKYYRRGVRLINGSDLPGQYNTASPADSRGFTVASENGVYVLGNYNATGVANAAGFSTVGDYLPQGARDVPASIAGDAVTVLSRSWSDASSFAFPYTSATRPATLETTARFAMLSGDSITTLAGTPNQGGNDIRMNGGVHNFIRFLEQWNVRLNYCGSLINLFYAHNNNGTYKNGNGTVYSPPTRNWIFDASFLDINRIPPGTPFFQSIQITGFQRMN